MAFCPTKEQLSAILAEHTKDVRDDKKAGFITVSAAAGSGKTAVVTERVIRLITECSVDVDRLLVVTFTNAAAAEMRARISAALDLKIAESSDPTRLIRQKMLLSKADICTVDAFCRKIVSEHFEEADMPPSLNMISAPQLEFFTLRALDFAFEHCYSEYKDEFYRVISSIGSDFAARDAVRKIYSFLRTLAYPDEWMDYAISLYGDFSRYDSIKDTFYGKTLIENGIDEAELVLHRLESANEEMLRCEETARTRGGVVEYCLKHAKAVLSALYSGDWDKVYELVLSFEKPSVKGRVSKQRDPEVKERVDAAASAYAKFIENMKKGFFMRESECFETAKGLKGDIELLIYCVKIFAEQLEIYKKSAAVVDFADIEYAALRLLVKRENSVSSPTETAKRFCSDVFEVLIDEYQDTNDLQNAIFLAVSQNGSKLFTVGDVKQSIYGFRKAEPSLFLSMLERSSYGDDPSSPDTKVILSNNFRSRKGICDGVNFIFSLLMSGDTSGIVYDETHALKAAGSFPERPSVKNDCTFCLIESKNDESCEREAGYIAGKIKSMMREKCITDAKTGKLRFPKYGDFAVLLRSVKNTAEKYAAVLRKKGIPVYLEGGSGFFGSPHVKKITALLRLINDPFDDIALLSCMVSPMFGFSYDFMARLRARFRGVPLYTAVLQGKSEDDRLADFVCKIDALRRAAVFLTPLELIDRILYDTGYAVFAAGDGQEASAAVKALKDLALQYPSSGYNGLSGFLRSLSAAEESGTDIKMPTSETSNDSVKIISVHSSKGLQFPVCFCAGLSNEFNMSDVNASILLDKTAGIGMMYTENGRRTGSIMRRAVSRSKKNELVSEELRIFYVSATRASDSLYLVGSCESAEKAVLAADGLIDRFSAKGAPLSSAAVMSSSSIMKALTTAMLLHPSAGILRSEGSLCYNCETTDSRFDFEVIHADEMPGGSFDEQPYDGNSEGEKNGDEAGDEIRKKTANEKTEKTAENHEGEKNTADERAFVSDDYSGCSGDDPKNDPVAERIFEEVLSRANFKYRYRALSSVAAKYGVTALISDSMPFDEDPAVPSFAAKEDGGVTVSSRDVGTAVHQFLRFMRMGLDENAVDSETERLVNKGLISKDYARILPAEHLAAFMRSPLYKRMSEGTSLKREWRFLYEVSASRLDKSIPPQSDEQVVIQGIADCVFVEGDGFVLVDYKTSKESAVKLAARYKMQLDIYAEAIENIYGIPVKEKIIYSLGTDTQVILP
mgnify:FL=1